MNKTKKAIFEAAIKVFSSSGYTEATMDDIALKAGVAKGTLYYHFKSKEEIFKFIISEGMNVIKEHIEEAVNKEENPLDKLRVFCKEQLMLVYENRDFFKMLMSQLWGEELRHLEIRDTIKIYISGIEKHLKDAMDKGYIEPRDTHFVSYTMFGTLCSAAAYEIVRNENKDINQVIEDSFNYILKGIQG